MIPTIVAEIGINHNGDLEIAKQLIDVAADVGCDFVKFQKRHIPSSYKEKDLEAPRKSPWGTTTREQKYGLEFSLEDYNDIDIYCEDVGIGWFYSPWDEVSARDMGTFDCPWVKVPSARVTDIPYLHAVKKHSDRTILSTGMSTLKEIDLAIDILGNVEYILHCTSTYPTKPKEINLRCIDTLKKRYPWAKIGFSNHYAGLNAIRGAAFLGAEMIEFHITLDRTMTGSDHAASIEKPNELTYALLLIDEMMGDGEKIVYDSELPIKEKLCR